MADYIMLLPSYCIIVDEVPIKVIAATYWLEFGHLLGPGFICPWHHWKYEVFLFM